MRIYLTPTGWELETDDRRRIALPESPTTREDLYAYLLDYPGPPIASPDPRLLAPIDQQ